MFGKLGHVITISGPFFFLFVFGARVLLLGVILLKFKKDLLKKWRIITLTTVPECHRITATSTQGD